VLDILLQNLKQQYEVLNNMLAQYGITLDLDRVVLKGCKAENECVVEYVTVVRFRNRSIYEMYVSQLTGER
jgi:hypothetical protein